jgi:GT2 family glycosyltransferase
LKIIKKLFWNKYYLWSQNINNKIELFKLVDRSILLFIFGLSPFQKAFKLLKKEKNNDVPFQNIKVSIIIPAYNQINYTTHCILSIFRSSPTNRFEILLADDCSTEDNYDLLDGIQPNVRITRTDNNSGFVKNCNHAARVARGDYLVFLNNDCLPLSGWLDNLIKTAESDASVGIVGSKLLYPNGSLQEAGGVIWRDGSGWNYGRGDNPFMPEYNYTKEVDYCTGASFCIKKSLWDELGGFDEYFAPAYYEETDLSFRLREKGYQTIYEPRSVAIHLEGISNGTDLGTGLKKHQLINRQKFLERWGRVLECDHFAPGVHERYARDRSKHKKQMLFIDNYLPRFDQDAGSRQVLSYLKLFKKEGFQITFWSDNRHYDPIYALELEKNGIEVISSRVGSVDFSEWVQKNGKYLDFALLNRPHVAIKYISEIKSHSKCQVIYYGHDLHVERMRLQNKYTPETFSEEVIKKTADQEEFCWNLCDLILYPSSDELEHLRIRYPYRRVGLLPIESRPDEEIEASLTPNSFTARDGLLFVGGFSHLPNQDAVLWFLNEVDTLMKRRLPNLKVTIAGNAPTDEIKTRASEAIVVTGRVSEEELRSLYNKVKVVVAPLRIGAGVKGKVVESLRMGVPVVTTSIGVQGLPGYEDAIAVADDPADFAKAVQDLLQDDALWQRRRDAGLKYYRENFSESVVAPKVLALLKGDS